MMLFHPYSLGALFRYTIAIAFVVGTCHSIIFAQSSSRTVKSTPQTVGATNLATNLVNTLATSANTSPWRIGIVGNVSTMFTNQALTGIARLPESFLSPLQDTSSQGFGAGLELEYIVNPWLSFALRGEYARTQSRSVNVVRLPAGGTRPPDMIQGQPLPRVIERRTALTFDTEGIAVTPLVRFRLWNILTLSGGARFDEILQMPLAYSVGIDSLVGTFITGTGPRRTLFSTQNFIGRTELSVSPVFSLGATVNIGKITLMPEIQIQTQFRPFTGTNWGFVALRGNLSVLLNVPLTKPEEIKTEANINASELKIARTTTASIIVASSASISSATLRSVNAQNSLLQSPVLPTQPIDTVVQRRDTTVRVVSWSERDTVRLVGRTITSLGEVAQMLETYERSIPKSRPFLVADLEVRFIPTLSASRSLETSQSARLATHRMIIRRFRTEEIDSNGAAKGYGGRTTEHSVGTQVWETLDTIGTVRMPILRFMPEISGELGIESSVVEVFTPEGGIIERFAVESKRPLDWDVQHLFLKPRHDNITKSLIAGTPLRSFLAATDTDGQIRRSDTVRIMVETSSSSAEKSDKNATSTPPNRTQNINTNANANTSPSRINTRSTWLIATLPVPLEESTVLKNQQVIKALVARLPRGKPIPCTVYVNASNNEASATEYAQTLATQIRANALQARIVRRALSFNAAATIELIVMVEEK